MCVSEDHVVIAVEEKNNPKNNTLCGIYFFSSSVKFINIWSS